MLTCENRITTLKGRYFATPTAMTVLINGNEEFSGQIGTGVATNTEFELLTHNFGSIRPGFTAVISISVTSGVMTVGPWYMPWPEDENAPDVLLDTRQNILINGQPPEWPATPMQFMPGGTPENPDWSFWFFEVSAGETITFNFHLPQWYPLFWLPNTDYKTGEHVWEDSVEYTVNSDHNSGATFDPTKYTLVSN